ncbi:NAD(P)-dependent oxidoreductase [Bacillus smithii]|uniref:NAD(P)-dependent oxidoreductase n=1 Tax=Bacillus smithii TaxID=1479 RepID=UPI002E1E031B|nr:NAD(P)-dependent oxidoreductase [Bacillus smithii]MED1456421.1 NAD(P)-dependent oxidoreductase [Bacillus smithii]
MEVVFSFFPPTDLREQLINEFPDCHFRFYRKISEAEWKNAEVIVTYGEDLSEKIIHSSPRLRWIMVCSAGLEKMPFQAIKEKNILVTNARGIHKIPMAEFTLGLMLQHVKRYPELADFEKQRVWNKKLPLQELAEKEVLVLGTGAIGSEIGRLSKAFRMKTNGVNRSGKPVDYFDRIYTFQDWNIALGTADFIVSVLPSTPETRYLLMENHFQTMKDTAVFINIGRGDLVEDKVLLNAAKQNQVAHIYLDVFEKEPLPPEHEFWTLNNITVTPHISAMSKNYLPRAFEILKHNLSTYITGGEDFWNVVDLDRGY